MHTIVLVLLLVAGLASTPAQAAGPLENALRTAAEREHDEGTASALKAYQEALKLAASGAEEATVLARIADCQARMSATADAMATLQRLLAIKDCRPEQKAEATLSLARIHRVPREAIALCEQFMAVPGRTAAQQIEARLCIAQAHAQRGECDLALPMFEKITAAPSTPDNVRIEALNGIGACRRELRQPAESLAAFEQIAAMTGAPPIAVAQAYVDIGDTSLFPLEYAGRPTTTALARATAAFDRAGAMLAFPFDRKMAAWTRLACAQRAMGDADGAIKTLQGILSHSALNANARAQVENDIGDCLADQKKYAEAVTWYQKAINLNRHDMLKKIGITARTGKDFVTAQHAFADLLPLTPTPENDEKGERKWVNRQLQILTKATVRNLKPSVEGIFDKPDAAGLDGLQLPP